MKSFNLVGNPFACNATIDRPFSLSFTADVISSEAKKSPLSELFSYLHLIDNMTGADVFSTSWNDKK